MDKTKEESFSRPILGRLSLNVKNDDCSFIASEFRMEMVVCNFYCYFYTHIGVLWLFGVTSGVVPQLMLRTFLGALIQLHYKDGQSIFRKVYVELCIITFPRAIIGSAAYQIFFECPKSLL